MKSLHDYFEQAREQSRSVTPEQLDSFVRERTAGNNRQPRVRRNNARRPYTKILATAIGTSMAAGAWLLWPDDGNTVPPTPATMPGQQHQAMMIEGCGCPLGEFVGMPGGKRSKVAPASLATLPMLELTTDELKRIGIEKHADGIILYRQRPGSAKEFTEQDRFRSDENDIPNKLETAPSDITPLPIYPRLVTDDLGRLRRFYFTYQEIDPQLEDSIRMVQQHFSYLYKAGKVQEARDSLRKHPRFRAWFRELQERSRLLINLNELVPVYIPAESSRTGGTQQRCRPGVIVWFDADSSLLQLLPSDWKERMSPALGANRSKKLKIAGKEANTQNRTSRPAQSGQINDAVAIVKKPSFPAPAQSEEITTANTRQETAIQKRRSRAAVAGPGPGESPFRVNPGAIASFSLLPNPVDKAGSLLLQLSGKRKVGISLHSIGGTQLGMLVGDQDLNAGEHSIALSFSDVAPGIYLLAVSTDHNELQVHRIIVR